MELILEEEQNSKHKVLLRGPNWEEKNMLIGAVAYIYMVKK